MANPLAIYVASRASIPARAAMWRQLRAQGWPIISSWIDLDDESGLDFGQLWASIEQEIAHANGLVLFVRAEDFPLRGALVEVGMALAGGKRVAVVAPDVDLSAPSFRPLGSWIAHPRSSLQPAWTTPTHGWRLSTLPPTPWSANDTHEEAANLV